MQSQPSAVKLDWKKKNGVCRNILEKDIKIYGPHYVWWPVSFVSFPLFFNVNWGLVWPIIGFEAGLAQKSWFLPGNVMGCVSLEYNN